MINVGIIGAGRIGRVHVESICTQIPDAKVKTLASPSMDEKREAWARRMGVEYVTRDYREILSDPEIDAVLICSSTDTHSSISIEAIEAGKHVFCEKPVDHDIARIKQVIAALEKHPVKYQVGFNRRFDHNFEAVHRAVEEGKIGDPHIIRITSRDPEPPSMDYINAEEIYVEAAALVDPEIGKAGDVDTAVITMKMENGAIVTIDNSRKAVYGYDQRVEVFGSKGMVKVTNDTVSSAVISNADGVTGEKPLHFFLERYMQSYAKEIMCFIQAIEQDTDTPLGILDGLEPVRMGIAAQRSLKEHRPVKLSEI